MDFDPDAYLASTEQQPSSGFDPDSYIKKTEPKSLSGFAKNLGTDALNTGKAIVKGASAVVDPLGVIEAIANKSFEPIKDAATRDWNTVKSIPGTLVNEGKRIGAGELLTGHPINAMEKFGEAAYEKPLTTALDVLPFAGAAGKTIGIGGKAAQGVELASEAAQAGKAAPIVEEAAQAGKAASLTDEAAQAGSNAGQGVEKIGTVGNVIDEGISHIGKKIQGPMDDVKNFLESKYAKVSEKPGWKDTLADYMKEHGQNMTLKELGAAPGQIRKIGVDKAHELADFALDNNLAGPTVGTIGREKMLPQMLDDTGGAVGAFRKMASDRGAVHNVDQLIKQVKAKLDDKYMTSGMYSGQRGSYTKGLMELKKSDPTAGGMAEKISEMFQESKNLDPLRRPSGALADIARQVRDINHDLISKHLNPQELATYENSLEHYGALKQINEFVKRRSSTEAGGRLGPGSGISRAAVQKFLDSVGYRTEAKIMRNLSEKIRSNPEIANRPQNLFRNYIDEAAHAIDEMGDFSQ